MKSIKSKSCLVKYFKLNLTKLHKVTFAQCRPEIFFILLGTWFINPNLTNKSGKNANISQKKLQRDPKSTKVSLKMSKSILISCVWLYSCRLCGGFQEGSKCIRVLQAHLKGVKGGYRRNMKIQVIFNGILGSFKLVSERFQGCYK